ncbi:TrmB family transcriptional regulator [Staphylothermus hellenicus]|uniref:Transcriptional regulator, TrmB n=1 Tax=Staphylothermus hellenicus (strain DSM 12710 / JCM 10830 / BK20S6-10-b1 / P8) TaxID=591019 RepID=D7DCF0_STAHD|nr:TrmB family transcriptional regulator sugar-binding domain-containing protein [Staphylothermus hellenicus]ADI31847.1 transcriptional regulator, TrmB [Staphylothermus hellenicus DSM 12710]
MSSGDARELIFKYLEFIGIKGYEAKAYLTLLKYGEETAPKLATRAGIPLPRIYDVLETLSRKGLVEVKAGRPRIYRALPPSLALTRYVKSYIEEVLEMNKRIMNELEKIYGSRESHEPYIWLSHSLEASIERTREWIKKMRVDGYASLNNNLVKELASTLGRKLKNNKEITFSLTLLEKPKKNTYEELEKIDNLMILLQPTGFINMYEQDLSHAALFGDNYTLFTTENELLIILNDTYYYGYWRSAEILKPLNIKRGDTYKTMHQWLAVSIIKDALSQGYTVELYVTGYRARDRKPVEIKGYAKSVYKSADDRTRTIYIETPRGEKVSVGGIGASREDVEARFMEIKIT